MARPFKQGLSYFPHDTDAHHDEKIQSLMALYGAEGYAFYFILLEKIFRMENGRITCGKLIEKAGLAKTIGITVEKFELILASALEIGCFDVNLYNNEKILTSNGIEKRIFSVNNIRSKDRNRKIKGKGKGKLKTENPRKTHGKLTIPLGTPLTENSYLEEKSKKVHFMGKQKLTDEQFITFLKNNPAYQGINIEKELHKMDAWLLTPKGSGRKKTHRFILNWLNRVEREVKTGGQHDTDTFRGTPYTNAKEKYAGVGKIPTPKLDGHPTKIS